MPPGWLRPAKRLPHLGRGLLGDLGGCAPPAVGPVPAQAASFTTELDGGVSRPLFLEVRAAKRLLGEEGFHAPTFQEILDGARPDPSHPEGIDPGEWRHGW